MVLLIIIFVVFAFTQTKVKDSISKIFIWSFFILWTGQSILSKFGIYDNFIPKDKTFLYVAIHLLFFYLGFSLYNKKLRNKSDTRNNIYLEYEVEAVSGNIYFRIVFAFAFLFVLYIFGKFWNAIIIAQSISDVREDNQLVELYGPAFFYLNMLVLYPISFILSFLFAYKTFKKRDIMWVLMGLFLVFYKGLGGGRLGFVSIFIGIVFVALILSNSERKHENLFLHSKRFILLGLFAVCFYFITGLVTAGRMGDVSMNSEAFNDSRETTNMHYYNYYVCPIVAFDYTVNNQKLIDQQGGYHYGLLTFNSIEEFSCIIFGKLGVVYQRPIEEYVRVFQDNQINVGSMSWNALYTWCNYFYCDLGIIGIVIFPFIMGLLVRKTIIYYRNRCNVFAASLLFFVYYILVLSEISYNLNGIATLTTIILLLFFSSRSGIKRVRMLLSK